jgi:hypothetical protein
MSSSLRDWAKISLSESTLSALRRYGPEGWQIFVDRGLRGFKHRVMLRNSRATECCIVQQNAADLYRPADKSKMWQAKFSEKVVLLEEQQDALQQIDGHFAYSVTRF